MDNSPKTAASPALIIVIAFGLYLLVTSAFFPLNFLSVFDAKRVLQLALAAGVIIFTVFWSPLRIRAAEQLARLPNLVRWCLLLFFLLGVVSSVRLEHPSYALVDVAMLFIMMLLIAIVAASRELSGRLFDQWAVLMLAAMGLAVFVQEFTGFISGWVMGSEFSYSQALIHFAHPRFYNQLQTWSIPVIAALPWIFPQKRWIRFGCIGLLGLQWFLVIAFAARGTAVSLLIAMTFMTFWLPEQRRFWLKYQLSGLLTGLLVYAAVLFINGLVFPQAESGDFYSQSVGRPMLHTTGRSFLWQLSVEDALDNPVLGAGPGRYACDQEAMLPAHPHSLPFRILGEWGVIAVLLFFILAVSIGLGFLRSLRHGKKFNQADPPLQAVLAISLIAGVIHACVSGLLIMPASQIAMILVAGWTLSLCNNKRPQVQNTFPSALLLIAGMVITCTTLVFATTEITHLPDRTSYSVHHGPMVPRFWQDGRICEYTYPAPVIDG